MKGKSLARAALVAVLYTVLAADTVLAQNIYGSLVGNVTDSSGAVLPGATVTATQTETNLTREVVTNETGAYSIPNIPNTPHFSSPAANISNVVFAADGSITSLKCVGGITATDRTGRQYDEREWRFGARFGF